MSRALTPIATAKEWLLRQLIRRDTLALEVFLALEAIIAGLYVLLPGPPVFEPAIVPDVILGGIMVTHGIGALFAVYQLDLGMERRSAGASIAIWMFVFTLLALTPPPKLIVAPLVLSLAGAGAWVFVRLSLMHRCRTTGH